MLGTTIWIVALLTQAGHDVPVTASPRSLDSRLTFEQIAASRKSSRPRAWLLTLVAESWSSKAIPTSGPRIMLVPPRTAFAFEDADGDGRFERVSTFFEGTKLTMGLKFARDGSLFVATRSATLSTGGPRRRWQGRRRLPGASAHAHRPP